MAEIEHDEVESSRAPLMDHLIELRQRLLVVIGFLTVGFIGCFLISGLLYEWLLAPYSDAASLVRGVPVEELDLTANFFAPLEFFFVKLKLALVGAIMVVFPVIAWQVYGFVQPGLYKNERGAFAPFLALSPVLFAAGVSFVYFLVLPMVMRFSLGQEQASAGPGISIELLLNVSDYMNLITTLMLVFGISFQMPILMMLLAKAGIINSKQMLGSWRFAVVGIALFAAFVTPPDPISQLMLGSALLLLYFISIVLMRWMEPKTTEVDEA
ncbi:twin-arginine translocase subunit TatC [Maricaulis sp.]|uniref:twin-arginine translocase subunit TatC n=1 Tax=Maricaulis sp. TaxID=1486257 RepID=UPI003A92E287|tara:strand:+ start:539 stop:1345 length:807 start_codon:yes stop_codon:yes gene_type:complete